MKKKAHKILSHEISDRPRYFQLALTLAAFLLFKYIFLSSLGKSTRSRGRRKETC